MYHTLRTYLRLMLMVPFVRLFMLLEETSEFDAHTRPCTLNQLATAYARSILHFHKQEWLGFSERPVWTGSVQHRLSRIGLASPSMEYSGLSLVHIAVGVYLEEGGDIWKATYKQSPEGHLDELYTRVHLSDLYSEFTDAALRQLMSGFELLQDVHLPLRTGGDQP